MKNLKTKKLNNVRELSVGDWIIFDDGGDKKIFGYVEHIDSYGEFDFVPAQMDEGYGFKPYRRRPFRDVSIKSSNYYTIHKVLNINEESNKFLIDLALLTKDKTWFKELVG